MNKRKGRRIDILSPSSVADGYEASTTKGIVARDAINPKP